MKRFKLIGLFVSMVFIFMLALSLPIFGYAATIRVPEDYPTIQAGINAAVNGDTVSVNNGTYYENIDFLGKAITVKSVNGPNVTVIDGNQQGSVVTFGNNELSNSVIDGFTITNGSGTYSSGYFGNGYCGGGIYIAAPWNVNSSAPTIINNIITGNSVTVAGGGIFGDEVFSTIRNNTISNNSAGIDGGGIYLIDVRPGASVTIDNNTISGNTAAGSGGGMCLTWVYGNANILANTITLNTSSGGGGGVFISGAGSWGAYATIGNNTIHQNTASFGGGGGIYRAIDSTISNNVITENQARSGGGIYAKGSYVTGGSGIISQNTISKNTAIYQPNSEGLGGGIYCEGSSPTILQNTISENYATNWGGGICARMYSAPDMESNLIVKNSTDTGNYLSKGGGILCDNTYGPHPIIKSNIIAENSSFSGAGINIFASSPQIINNLIYKNSAVQDGGGLHFWLATTTLTNNTITNNSAGNWGGGMYCMGNNNLTVANSILWGDNALLGPEIALGSGGDTITFTTSYSDVQGGQSQVYLNPYSSSITLNWGLGMIDADPRFKDVTKDDFHLTIGSSCLDAGDPNPVGLPPTDFEGDKRIIDGDSNGIAIVDIGADEFKWKVLSKRL